MSAKDELLERWRGLSEVEAALLLRMTDKVLAGELSVDGVPPSSLPLPPEPSQHVAVRRRLPKKRRGATDEIVVGQTKMFVRLNLYPTGELGEIWLDVPMHKEGMAFRSMMMCWAMAISIGLQHGIPLSSYYHTFRGIAFEPDGAVCGYAGVERAQSCVDAVMQIIAVELPGQIGAEQVAGTSPHQLKGSGEGPKR